MINKSMPVSREDYDRMADQRDAFRAALVAASTHLEGALRYCAEVREALAVYPDALDDVERNAQAGLDAVTKALKSR